MRTNQQKLRAANAMNTVQQPSNIMKSSTSSSTSSTSSHLHHNPRNIRNRFSNMKGKLNIIHIIVGFFCLTFLFVISEAFASLSQIKTNNQEKNLRDQQQQNLEKIMQTSVKDFKETIERQQKKINELHTILLDLHKKDHDTMLNLEQTLGNQIKDNTKNINDFKNAQEKIIDQLNATNAHLHNKDHAAILQLQKSIVLAKGISSTATTPSANSSTQAPKIPQVKHHTNKKQKSTTSPILESIMLKKNMFSEIIWKDLLTETISLEYPAIVIEVGAQNAEQCVQAAKQSNVQVHCIEPSPKSFQTITNQVNEQPAYIQQRIQLHNIAASSESNGTITFVGSGSTGDHVGLVDIWTMKKVQTTNDLTPTRQGKMDQHQVPQRSIDDLILHDLNNTKVYLIKIDTQGFEPAVFQGLQRSIQAQNIDYILTEYWPKGMDLMMSSTTQHQQEQTCTFAVKMLQDLVNAEYKLYALTINWHGKERYSQPKEIQEIIKQATGRPYDDLKTHCQWYYSLEKYSSENYKMGYWSDILAVSPYAPFDNPITTVGKLIKAKY